MQEWFYKLLTFDGYDFQQSLIIMGKALAIFLVIILLRRIFASFFVRISLKIAAKTKFSQDEAIIKAMISPVEWFFIVLAVFSALMYLPLTASFRSFLTLLFRSAVILLITKGLFNLLNSYGEGCIERQQIFRIKVDKILIPILIKVGKIILIILAVTIIAEEWNYSVSSLIAGLGLGGLALALAAQSLLSELLSGMAIITDKVFFIGEWIQTTRVEGTVEDINFRSTKVRTFDNALVTVPNSLLINEPLINWSRMGKRRIVCRLGVTYNTTADQMRKVVSDIEEMLKNHPEILPDSLYVNFDKFGDNALEIQLYFHTKITVFGDFLKVKEDINLRLLDILEQNQVSAAFPSISIYFENTLQTSDQVFAREHSQSNQINS